MAQPSRLYKLIERQLQRHTPGTTLAAYIAASRPTKSWDTIAAELATITGVEASGETLRLWFADRIEVETQVTVHS